MASSQTEHRLRPGQPVQVERENTKGNPRTPHYIRGKRGVVVILHGTIVNPIDHHGVYPPLCTVQFNVREVFGRGNSSDTLLVDLHEDWLASA